MKGSPYMWCLPQEVLVFLQTVDRNKRNVALFTSWNPPGKCTECRERILTSLRGHLPQESWTSTAVTVSGGLLWWLLVECCAFVSLQHLFPSSVSFEVCHSNLNLLPEEKPINFTHHGCKQCLHSPYSAATVHSGGAAHRWLCEIAVGSRVELHLPLRQCKWFEALCY